MGATDIASRLRAKFTKRRHSTEGSQASSTRSVTDTSSSFGSRQVGDRDRAQSRQNGDGDRSSRAASNSRGTISSRRGMTATNDYPQRQHEDSNEFAKIEVSQQVSEAEAANSNSDSAENTSSETDAEAPGAVPHTNDHSTARDAALKHSAPPVDQQGLGEEPATAATSSSSSDQHQPLPSSDLRPPQPRPQINPPPLISPSLHPQEQSSPSRPHQASSNLDRIHEDAQDLGPESSTARLRVVASLDLDAASELAGHNDDNPLSPDQAPNSPRSAALAPLATATSTTFVAPFPGLPPSGILSVPGSPTPRPAPPPRQQSLLSNRQTTLINTLLSNQPAHEPSITQPQTYAPINGNMVIRKIWVKRPHCSPTLVTVNEDDLVDDVRDMILRKYSNSLGRSFDSPDINIRIIPRDQHSERILNPEEPMGRTLDAYYPNGQTVEEALVIDIPRRPPKASPRPVVPPYVGNVYYSEDGRPTETSDGYFPPAQAGGAVGSPHLPVTVPVHGNPGSIAVLGTGQLPPIPSPGRVGTYRHRPVCTDRPRLGRTHTSSPTLIANTSSASLAAAAVVNHANHGTQHFNPRLPHSRTHSNSSDAPGMPPAAPPLPTPPAPEPTTVGVSTPPVRPSSPRPTTKIKKSKKSEHPSLPPGMLNGGVPPINVLIVEDNPINLKLLEAFVKRLKVRWSTAMNGRDAVKKWRSGGFHLVLMDIQLPVMNGLDATREIRRLERVNSIGVFSSSPDGEITTENPDEIDDKDRLDNASLFKSPVIIVALTASSLQSDRHEALAAGCNDFLTKPVNFDWLERKVMEWGCMQALIDFDGWRKWKEISQEAEENEAAKKAAAAAAKAKSKKNRVSMTKPG
ncbi:osomolarity two-component response regulator ssk1 [Fusarium longipes]|uniref:Osomolarity two-component response regulator ssk1 n=1 Tax=Fusarium longipes TaxID=694270 RepID=A0A395S714_9HYPO|nr:osomolarity two-component response regulator ssk1 [Fusarium longipes]